MCSFLVKRNARQVPLVGNKTALFGPSNVLRLALILVLNIEINLIIEISRWPMTTLFLTHRLTGKLLVSIGKIARRLVQINQESVEKILFISEHDPTLVYIYGKSSRWVLSLAGLL